MSVKSLLTTSRNIYEQVLINLPEENHRQKIKNFDNFVKSQLGPFTNGLKYVGRLWRHIMERKNFVLPYHQSAFDVGRICKWEDDPNLLMNALMGTQVLILTKKGIGLIFNNPATMMMLWRRSKTTNTAGNRTFPLGLRNYIIHLYEGKCYYCAAAPKVIHIDHVVPICLGGTSEPNNLVVACAPCNLAKGAKELV